MNKRNLISATLIIFMSIVSMVFGYWLGEKDKRRIAMSHIGLVDFIQEQGFRDTSTDLNILQALREGNNDIAYKVLTLKVKSGLTYFVVDDFLGENIRPPVKPSKKLLERASEYQSKYCSDKCLGI